MLLHAPLWGFVSPVPRSLSVCLSVAPVSKGPEGVLAPWLSRNARLPYTSYNANRAPDRIKEEESESSSVRSNNFHCLENRLSFLGSLLLKGNPSQKLSPLLPLMTAKNPEALPLLLVNIFKIPSMGTKKTLQFSGQGMALSPHNY